MRYASQHRPYTLEEALCTLRQTQSTNFMIIFRLSTKLFIKRDLGEPRLSRNVRMREQRVHLRVLEHA